MKSLSTTHIKELNHPTIKETNKLTLSYDPTNKLQILNQFEIIKEIGTGMHSRVKLGYDLMAQKPIAIKIMNRKEKKRSKFTFEQNAKIRQEINCLKRINNNHNNIVKLFEVLDDFQSRKIYLILEYCPGGEIKWCNDTDNELDARGPPRWSFQRVREMIRDVILGLEYLHNKGIIHRDIKPANLLISKNNTVKISDFSISLILNHTASTEHNDDFLQIIKTEGTPAFFAPEICLGADVEEKFNISSSSPSPSPVASPQDYLISTKIDVWALGITAYCLLFGMLPFTSKFELKLFDKIVNQPLEFPEYVTLLHNNVSLPASIQEYELAKDFISSLLIKNPLQRSSIDDCKNHRFICFDFNNNLINDQRTKDVKLQQKLKFLTKQVISWPDENNSNNNNNNDFIYTEDMDSNAHCDMDSFLSPIASPTTSEGDNSSISRSNTPTNTLPRSKKSNEKNKYNRNHRNKNKQTHSNDNTMVHLPINSSFASLDSFYIENFAMSKLNQDDPSIFNNKFKSSSQPVMDYSPKHSQTDLVVPRTRRRGKHRKKDPNTFNIDSGSANNSTVYLDDNSNKSNSSIRVNVHDLNSQPSSRVPSNNKLSQNNSSGFSSNVSMSSNGSMHRELFKGRVSPHIPFHNDSLPKLSSIDKVLDPSAHTSTDKKKKKNCKRTDRHIDKFAYNELYTSTNENRTTSAVDSDKSLNMSNFSSSPTQPSYYVTSEDASVVSLRNLPHFSNMIPPETIASLMASSNSASSLTTSRSSSSISSSSSSSSSSSFSESNSNSINHSGDFESDSGEELILNIGNSGHMRRRQSQYTSKLEQQTNDASIELSQSNRTLPCSPIRLKRNSSSSSQHFGSLSARPSATNLLQTNTINEDNIMTESFISGEIDSRMLLKDVLDNTPSNNKQQ